MATKPKSPNSKKSKATPKSVLPVPSTTSREIREQAAQSVLPPPTSREVKELAKQRLGSDKQRKRSGRRFENSGSESEDSEDLSIISVKRAKQPSTDTPNAQLEQPETAVTDMDMGSDQDTIPARGGDVDKHPWDLTTSNPGDQANTTTTTKKKVQTSKKARLVSYSSQGDSQDETAFTTSQRSGRKSTAVTKMGGVMIDLKLRALLLVQKLKTFKLLKFNNKAS